MFPRQKYLEQLIQLKDTDLIKVITGVRRAGKSVLLLLYADYLRHNGVDERHLIYMNFESLEHQTIHTAADLQKKIESQLPDDDRTVYLLLDEIQYVEEWQKLINGIRVSLNSDIVITGSNAQMLSGELATLLSGRYVEIPVYPLSFSEFLTAKNIDPHSREIDRSYREYETFGGFPGVVLAGNSIKDTVLSGIFDSIVLNDIAFRAGIKDTDILKKIIYFMADNVGQRINPTKMTNILKNQGLTTSNHTVNRYLTLLEQAFLFYKVKPYDIRGKAYLGTNAKYFIVDNGLRRHAVGKKDANYSNRLENIVYMELKRRGYTVDVGRMEDKEIDFIAKTAEETLYVQVAYDLPQTSRETDNLLMIKDNYKKILVTGRYHPQKEIDGIPVIYIVDWLIEQ